MLNKFEIVTSFRWKTTTVYKVYMWIGVLRAQYSWTDKLIIVIKLR